MKTNIETTYTAPSLEPKRAIRLKKLLALATAGAVILVVVGFSVKQKLSHVRTSSVGDRLIGLSREDGTKFWISSLEVTTRQYLDYLAATGHNPGTYWDAVQQNQLQLPITCSADEAINYCAWLTFVDRRKGILKPNEYYTLPSDREWSMSAGQPDEPGSTPKERADAKTKDMFPWNGDWPPKENQANTSYADTNKNPADRYPGLAPVGAFNQPNNLGISDMGGNAAEWTRTPLALDKKNIWSIRGGNFSQDKREDFLIRTRTSAERTANDNKTGFRIVIVDDPAKD